jgi:hypothetical protein
MREEQDDFSQNQKRQGEKRKKQKANMRSKKQAIE